MENFLKHLEALPKGSVSAVIQNNQALVVANDLCVAALLEHIIFSVYPHQFDDLEIRVYLANRERETTQFMFRKQAKKIC